MGKRSNTKNPARLALRWGSQGLRALTPAWIRPIRYLENKAFAGCGGEVAHGPFAGMRYVRRSFGSAWIPKMLGIYERELHEILERASNQPFDRIIDIGAAEGYYAVGLARLMPDAQVVAFEANQEAHEVLIQMASQNNVDDRVEVRGVCESEDLREALKESSAAQGRLLIVCDCEGFEKELLDPGKLPDLASSHILVELHEFAVPGIGDLLHQRFSHSHHIEQVFASSRSRSEYPFRDLYIALLPKRYLNWAVSEWRPRGMSWMWMTPNAWST